MGLFFLTLSKSASFFVEKELNIFESYRWRKVLFSPLRDIKPQLLQKYIIKLCAKPGKTLTFLGFLDIINKRVQPAMKPEVTPLPGQFRQSSSL